MSIFQNKKYRPVWIPAAALGLIIGLAALAPVIAPYDPTAIEISNRLAAPNAAHWLGQDELGRDVLSRLIYGARVSLSVAFVASLIAAIIGISAGLVGGYYQGIAEILTIRTSEILLSFPPILFALLVVTFAGPGSQTLMLVLGILYAPKFARLTYGETLTLRNREYVDAMRAVGASDFRILTRTILPNLAAPLLVQFSLTVSAAIVVESGLSFLGLGVVPPDPSWGLMIRGARSYMTNNPWGLVWPCLLLLVTIYLVNQLCDALRDAFDPKFASKVKKPAKTGVRVGVASKVGETNAKTTSRLEVKDLHVQFTTGERVVNAVNGVSFTVEAGKTLAVVGESGSGKSVTALSIMQLAAPGSSSVEGSIKFNGKELLTASGDEIRQIRGNEIAMIFQEPMTSLNPVLTIGFQINEALIRHRGMSRGEADKETIRLLERVRIPAAAARVHEYPHRFSGGMRQRVMIAMALACGPKLLIADEPTTALDVTIQAQILELIKELQREEGMSVLFITHDMGVVAEVADNTVVMYKGEAVETGTTAEIFANPKHPYTQSLLAAVPRLGSMGGSSRPRRFPTVDRSTGVADLPLEVPDTVKASERPVLEVSGLTTRFDIRTGLFATLAGRVHAVENVSFDVRAGETLALVGESGCGKSTTGRSIMRLLEPNKGTVLLDGVDILGLGVREMREQRRRIQMIFQDPFASLNPRINVGTAIAEPLLINRMASRAEAKEKVNELLKRVGLQPEMAKRYPHEFSGGQRQRISIARALALEPRLIVADESVSALDVSVKAQVVNLMLDLQASMGLSYLFISHDMAVVERVSHRVAVMYLGEIVEIGPRQAIFENPQHPYTKRLLAAVPVADPARRHEVRNVINDELKSPIRTGDYQTSIRQYREVSPGHAVMIWGSEWEGEIAAA